MPSKDIREDAVSVADTVENDVVTGHPGAGHRNEGNQCMESRVELGTPLRSQDVERGLELRSPSTRRSSRLESSRYLNALGRIGDTRAVAAASLVT